MRGFRLESLGILVARSSRPRPWRHLASLKELSRKLDDHWTSLCTQYSDAEESRDWTLLKDWYLRRVFRRIGEEGKWVDWEEELSSECVRHNSIHSACAFDHLRRPYKARSSSFTFTPFATNLGTFVVDIVQAHAGPASSSNLYKSLCRTSMYPCTNSVGHLWRGR